MRRSEILNLEWQHIDWKTQRALLPITKNGRSRWVPFSELALKHLEQVPRTADRFFPITDVAFRQAWDRLRNRAGITDLKFHDLRHEGLSQMFESGMSIPQVMAISGHGRANFSDMFNFMNRGPCHRHSRTLRKRPLAVRKTTQQPQLWVQGP